MASRNKKGLGIELQPDGRPARPTVPDSRKIGTRLDHRVLPQVPSVASAKIRHTVVPRRGSR
jgi:hypothetical protein